jgi:branched-chain amino acid transport system substrate-binding protein
VVKTARRPFPLALVGGLLAAACVSPTTPRPAGRESRVEPLVLAHPAAPRDGRLAVAAIFPSVGRYALSGVQSLNGARLAVADLNQGRGIGGRQVALLEYPIGSYFLDARQAAAFAAEAGALAIVGSNSSDLSMAIAEEAETRGIVQVTNVSTAQDLTFDPATGRSRRFVFRVCSSDGAMGGLLAAFARDDLGARRAAVLYEVGRTYSTRLARSFVERFKDPNRSRVSAEFVYLALETDFRAQLKEVQAFKPDVLFLPGSFTDATLIARQAEQLGLRATLLGADAWSSPFLFKRGGPSRPAHFLDHCSPSPTFDERYRRAFGQATQGCRAALAYDAVQAIAAGLRSLGRLEKEDLDERLATTRRRLRDATAVADFAGITGRVRFDEVGDRPTGMAVMAVLPTTDGRFETRLEGWVGGR